MALWMEEGSCPTTEQERADLDAIAALKESAAIELKEQGNQYVKMGRKHYADAVNCYTRAIDQKVLGDAETSVLFANRAHVNLLLGNYRRAVKDAEQAIQLSPGNVKAHYRAAKAAFSLDLLSEAASFCKGGLDQFPGNDDLRKLGLQIDSRRQGLEDHRFQVSQAVSAAKDLSAAIERRNLKLGKAMFQELTGLRKPIIDENSVLHWPVLLLYAEVMSSDFIEDFCETDSLPWDSESAYSREAVELYYQAGYGIPMSKKEILRNLLEGTAGALADDIFGEEGSSMHTDEHINSGDAGKWIKVNEKKMLRDILCRPDYIIPGIPAFFVVSKRSSFYKEFKAGKWTPP
ncbi:unnamed protein product [Spirodela intermedia]|uniref:Uncharacterized protein n=1 Tax=Spirodela intermedia TaxID=51605 RepID=A0A7I8K378_SPIIN|nr:unnamed protein product [Spirodela intermedia]